MRLLVSAGLLVSFALPAEDPLRLAIGLEMFPASAQSGLDAWNGGGISEEKFLETSRWYQHWGYNWGYSSGGLERAER